jgi:hypothetical protein
MIKLKELIEMIFDSESVPPILYHGTFNKLTNKIKKHGLVPGGREIQNFSGIEGGVYLGLNPEYAVSMVEASENDSIPPKWFDDIAIIAINTSKIDLSKLDIDPNVLPQEDEYDDDIPADDTVYSFIYRGIISPDAIISIDRYSS